MMLGTFVGKFAFDYEINEWYEFVETHWKKVDRHVVTRDMCRYILTNPNEFLRKIASSSLSPFIEENVKLVAMNLFVEESWRHSSPRLDFQNGYFDFTSHTLLPHSYD